MRATEAIARQLSSLGVDHYFVVTGGAIAPLVDEVARRRRREDGNNNNDDNNSVVVVVVAFQHEQAAVMAAEGYYRESGGKKLAAVLVTSGPGVQNTFNGLCGCYYDSVPVLLVCGNVNTSESLDSLNSSNNNKSPRQRGFQEMPVVGAYSQFSVYSKRVCSGRDRTAAGLCRVFAEAVRAATTPRFGPAVVDLPVNVQMDDVGGDDELPDLILQLPAKRPHPIPSSEGDDPAVIDEPKLREALELLSAAERPLFLFGAGVRAAGAVEEADRLVGHFQIPFLLSWGAKDLFHHDHPLNMGSHGVYGSRAANLAVQNCDFLFVLGSRLDSRQTGGRTDLFSRASKKVVVDVDEGEVNKLGQIGIKIALPIVAELKSFLAAFLRHCGAAATTENGGGGGGVPDAAAASAPAMKREWVDTLASWRQRYEDAEVDRADRYGADADGADADGAGPMSVYAFLERLDAKLPSNASIVPDCGGNLCWSMQALKVKAGQRLYTNLGNSSMGFSGPCTIGSALAARQEAKRTGKPPKPVVCICGDGGYLLNIQELKTIVDYDLPVKTFILNNVGYGIIRQFQDSYFESRHVATVFPPTDLVAVARSFGMRAFRIESLSDVDAKIDEAFAYPGPVLVDVAIVESQKIAPKLEFGNALEHMTPFIPLEELRDLMIVDMADRRMPGGWVSGDGDGDAKNGANGKK